MEKINTDKAPAAIGPYSQGIILNNLVFTSGQIPIDPATGAIVDGGIVEQTEQVFTNLKEVLAAADSGFNKVVKTTVFLSDMGNFATVNGIYAKYFTETLPARSAIEVSKLPKDSMIEIEVIATR